MDAAIIVMDVHIRRGVSCIVAERRWIRPSPPYAMAVHMPKRQYNSSKAEPSIALGHCASSHRVRRPRRMDTV